MSDVITALKRLERAGAEDSRATQMVCGQCGASRLPDQVVWYGENDFPEVGDPQHRCGFVAIRCRSHRDADRLAREAVCRHLLTVARREPY